MANVVEYVAVATLSGGTYVVCHAHGSHPTVAIAEACGRRFANAERLDHQAVTVYRYNGMQGQSYRIGKLNESERRTLRHTGPPA